MPFSIQIPTIDSTQATFSVLRPREAGKQQQDRRQQVHADGRPDPRHQRRLPVETEIEITSRRDVCRVRVELREHLTGQQKHIDDHGNLHDPAQREQGLVVDLVTW